MIYLCFSNFEYNSEKKNTQNTKQNKNKIETEKKKHTKRSKTDMPMVSNNISIYEKSSISYLKNVLTYSVRPCKIIKVNEITLL